MAKAQIHFLCKSCGAVQPRWMGKCPDCGAWDTLEEFRESKEAKEDKPRGGGFGGGFGGGHGSLAPSDTPQAMPLKRISEESASSPMFRIPSGIGEFDRVLGGVGEGENQKSSKTGAGSETSPSHPSGKSSKEHPHPNPLPKGEGTRGLVPGSVVLIGGDPGIGKSTLMLQAAHEWASRKFRVLYVTSEESAQQLKLRADRLAPDGRGADELFVLADTNLARIQEQARKTAPQVLIIDSVQMIYKGDLTAAPGSLTQLRSCCQELVYFAKSTGAAVLLVGHVTKEGRLAGPKLLEHMVDAVLYFEGDRYHSHRIVRGIKNRFGSTLEVGLFEMTGDGLREVKDGSGLLSGEYRSMAGSVICPVLQGSRCLLVEIQALTADGFLGNAKRKSSGLDSNRLAMLIAVLEKRGGLRLADQDVFVSSVGGMKVAEPAVDLALALAIAGAHLNRKVSAGVGEGVCAVGEIGLGGEVRLVQQLQQRVHEAARLGFKTIICPAGPVSLPKGTGARLVQVKTVSEALGQLGN
jgi:DNA repair protein RadA/Sms